MQTHRTREARPTAHGQAKGDVPTAPSTPASPRARRRHSQSDATSKGGVAAKAHQSTDTRSVHTPSMHTTLLTELKLRDRESDQLPTLGGFHFYHDQDRKTHTPRARTGLSVALAALSRATRSWPTCAPSVRSRARPTGSHGTMQHGCRAVAVSDALPMVTRTMLVCTTCLSHALT